MLRFNCIKINRLLNSNLILPPNYELNEADGSSFGLMDVGSDGENVLIILEKGKKHQRTLDGSVTSSVSLISSMDRHEQSVGSTRQGSREL